MTDLNSFSVGIAKLIQRLIGDMLSSTDAIEIDGLTNVDGSVVPRLPYVVIRHLGAPDNNSFITDTYYNNNRLRVYETHKDLVYRVDIHADDLNGYQIIQKLYKSLRYDSSTSYINTEMAATILDTTPITPLLNLLSDRRNQSYTFDITFTVVDSDVDSNSTYVTSVEAPTGTLI